MAMASTHETVLENSPRGFREVQRCKSGLLLCRSVVKHSSCCNNENLKLA